MSLLGNLIWLIFGGLLTGLGYIVGGLVLCLTVVGIPFGLQSMKLGVLALAPFGREVVPDPQGDGVLRTVMNVIWLLLFGWEIALAHLGSALLLALTIIGLPFAAQHLKLIPVALLPFGRTVR